MLTNSGVNMMPGGGDAPHPYDLAVHMGRICQFGGAIWWTLLAHSVLVGELVLRELVAAGERNGPAMRAWAWALLHDAHEVVTSDIPNGWKPPEMKALQAELDRRIIARYKLDVHEDLVALVKKHDKRACSIQAQVLKLCGYTGETPLQPPTTEEETLVRWLALSPLNDPAHCTRGLGCTSIARLGFVFSCIERGAPAMARLELLHEFGLWTTRAPSRCDHG